MHQSTSSIRSAFLLRRGLLAIGLLYWLTTDVVAAEQTTDDSKNPAWQGSAELGYVNTGGNTETQTVNAKAKLKNERNKWRHTMEIAALNSSDQDTTTAEHYTALGQSNYKMTPRDYVFAVVSYENDRFSGYNYRVSEALGYGRRVIENAKLILDLEAGPGARQSKLDTGESDNNFIVRGAGKLEWTIGKASKFNEEVTVESGEDATITKSVTSLRDQLVGNLAMKISYTLKHTSDVPPGIEKTDTETAVTLVYSF